MVKRRSIGSIIIPQEKLKRENYKTMFPMAIGTFTINRKIESEGHIITVKRKLVALL